MLYLNLGRREQGKTTLALYLTRRTQQRVIFDPRGLVPSGALPRVRMAHNIKPVIDRVWESGSGDIVCTPDGAVQPFFERLCSEVKAWVREPGAPPIAFIVDELRFVETKAPAFDWLTRCATRAQITIVGTAHRPADVTVDMRAIADVWCLFHMTQEHDLRVVQERCSEVAVRAVQNLKPREFVAWDDTSATMTVCRDPKAWYRPLQSPDAPPAAGDDLGLPAGEVDKTSLFD